MMKLFEDLKALTELTIKREKYLRELEDENKRLKFDIEARKEMKKAREEKIRFLEECLDNKEKVNKGLREELGKYKKYYDRDKEELMESCYALAKENDELNSELSEQYVEWGGLMDEIDYRKRECKKLKKIKICWKTVAKRIEEDKKVIRM